MPRVALVTGSSRGIGRGIALALASRGWSVAINYARNEAAAAVTAADVRAAGGQALTWQADIADLASHAPMLDHIERTWGSLDLLVNNAGIGTLVRGDLLDATPESYDVVLNTNLRGPYFLTQAVARGMVARNEAGGPGGQNIITVSSMSVYTASTSRGDYCLSKAGLAMMTALFADRLAPHGINVYEIRPGLIATDMTAAVRDKYERLIGEGLTPIRRWGQPEDVGRAVLAIAEGFFPYSTGQVIDVDGGFHVRTL